MQDTVLEQIENQLLDKHLKEEYICHDCGKTAASYYKNRQGLIFCDDCLEATIDELADELVTLANKYTAFRSIRYGEASDLIDILRESMREG